ncbi:MAG: carboxypeptidase-like regulatory domain-containing protein [Planctomycetota bacterium]
MTPKRLALIAAALAAAAALAVLVHRTLDGPPVDSTRESVARTSAPASDSASPNGALAVPEDGQARSAAPAHDVATSGRIDPALSPPGAVRTGVVRTEDGAPLGEPVEVRASTRGPSGSFIELARASVSETDGSFRLGLPTEPPGPVTVQVLAEFLALPEPAGLEEEGPLDLVVRRGACLLVELVGPAAGDPDAHLGPDFSVCGRYLATTANGERVAFEGRDGRLRIGGVDPDLVQWLVLDAKRFVPTRSPVPALRTGERTEVRLPVHRGVAARGRVVDEKGDALGGVTLRLGSWDHEDLGRILGREAIAESDEEGRFDVGAVLPGNMTLRVRLDGYDGKNEALGMRTEGDVVEGLLIALVEGSGVSGTVRWPDGSPAPDASVLVKSAGGTWAGAKKASAAEDGTFEFTGLRSSALEIRASKKNEESRDLWHGTVKASLGLTVDVVLAPGLGKRGRVVDDLGEPVSAFRVKATPVGRNKGWKDASRKRSRGDGTYELEGLADALYDVVATARGHVASAPVRIDAGTEEDVPDLVVARLASVIGTVVDTAGVPLQETAIRIGGKKAVTDEEGKFSAEKVPPGECSVRSSNETFGVVRSGPITLSPGEERSGETVILARGSKIVGRLHSSLAGGIYREATLRPAERFEASSADIDGEGNFVFDSLRAGDYWVSLASVHTGDWADGYRDARPVPITVPQDAEVSLVLGDPASYPIELAGTITRDGDPAEGQLIYIYREGGDRTFPAALGRTRDDGTYSVRLRLAGRYAFNVGEGQAQQVRFEIDVTDARKQTMDFELPDRVVRGRAVLADGTPASGRMYVLASAGAPKDTIQNGTMQFTTTKRDGTFEFVGLRPGEYRLHTGNYLRCHDTDGLLIVKGIDVPAKGEVDPLSLTIPEGAIVECSVVGPAERPRAGLKVTLEDDDGNHCVIYDMRRTDANGRLRWTGVGPGRWTAVVRDQRGRVLGTEPVTVAAGQSARITLRCET